MFNLRIKLFADGADLNAIADLASKPYIQGFTTNPTLMRKAGITDYAAFAREALVIVGDRPISFEVFSDEFDEMARQARRIASWGENVYVKIPITNTRGESSIPLIRELAGAGIRLNVTAIFTLKQVEVVADAVQGGPPAIVSVFAGRIADAGCDPEPLMADALTLLQRAAPAAELLWASPREVFNVVQADRVGCHIITATPDILAKLPSLGKDLDAFSLETVQMFYRDAQAAGFQL